MPSKGMLWNIFKN